MAVSKNFSKKEAVNFGFEIAKKNVFFFISLFVVIAITYTVLGLIQAGLSKDALAQLVLGVIRAIAGTIISMGVIKISLDFIDSKKPKIKDVFYTKSIINYFVVSFVKTLITFIGFILLIVPGIIFAIKLQFATYLVVDKNKGIVEALQGSWEMTKGVKWNLFLFWILLFLINVLGFLLLIVGLVITIPLSMVAMAYVYRKLA